MTKGLNEVIDDFVDGLWDNNIDFGHRPTEEEMEAASEYFADEEETLT